MLYKLNFKYFNNFFFYRYSYYYLINMFLFFKFLSFELSFLNFFLKKNLKKKVLIKKKIKLNNNLVFLKKIYKKTKFIRINRLSNSIDQTLINSFFYLFNYFYKNFFSLIGNLISPYFWNLEYKKKWFKKEMNRIFIFKKFKKLNLNNFKNFYFKNFYNFNKINLNFINFKFFIKITNLKIKKTHDYRITKPYSILTYNKFSDFKQNSYILVYQFFFKQYQKFFYTINRLKYNFYLKKNIKLINFIFFFNNFNKICNFYTNFLLKVNFWKFQKFTFRRKFVLFINKNLLKIKKKKNLLKIKIKKKKIY